MFSAFRKKPAPQTTEQSVQSTMKRITSPSCTQEQFVLLYAKLLEERQPGMSIVMTEPLTIEMKLETGETSSTFINNLWIQWKRADDREELINKHVNAILAILRPKPTIDRRQIIPIVKDSVYVQDYGDKMIVEHLAADLYCVYAIDWEDRTETLSQEKMVGLGLEQSELRELALQNLQSILPAAECHGEGPWFLLSAGTDYVASLLLFDGLWDQLAEMINGDPVAVAPARDVLLFTGSESNEGITVIRRQAEEIVTGGDHVISGTLLRRQEGKWKAFN